MTDVIIQVEKLAKQYRLGEVSTGTLGHDLNRWWHRFRGKEDPYLKVTAKNVREEGGKVKAEAKSTSAFTFHPSSLPPDYVWALQDITFEVKRGEVLGVIGRNGAGKSTLLKILSRVTAPTQGEIRIDGRIAALLEVGTGFHPELTGRENIFLNGAILGMTKAEIAAKLDEIVEFSGCARYLDTPTKRYSSGMVVRLGFAVAAHLEPDILIVDEVLAVGDAEFQKKCIGKMQDVAGHGRTILFVSHNMAAVERLCTSALVIDSGRVVLRDIPENCIEKYLETSTETKAHDFENLSGGALTLSRFALTYDHREVTDIYFDGKDIGFDIVLHAGQEYRSFAIHIGLYTSLGTLICICRSDAQGNIMLHPGENRIFCSLGSIPLATGHYYCNVFMSDKSQPLGIGRKFLDFRVISGVQHHAHVGSTHALLTPRVDWRVS